MLFRNALDVQSFWGILGLNSSRNFIDMVDYVYGCCLYIGWSTSLVYWLLSAVMLLRPVAEHKENAGISEPHSSREKLLQYSRKMITPQGSRSLKSESEFTLLTCSDWSSDHNCRPCCQHKSVLERNEPIWV